MSDDPDKKESLTPTQPAEPAKDSKPPSQSSSPIEPEVLEKLPPEVRKVVESFFVSAPVYNPILKKITESHIDKVLEQTEKDSDRTFRDVQSTKKYHLVYVLIFAILFVFAVVFLVDRNPELLKDMIKYLAVFAGGYGFKSFVDRRDND